jgi:hypothetical protein
MYLIQHLITPSCQEYCIKFACSAWPEMELIRQDDKHLTSTLNSIITSTTSGHLLLDISSYRMSIVLTSTSEGHIKPRLNLHVREAVHPHHYFINFIQDLDISSPILVSVQLTFLGVDTLVIDHVLGLDEKLAPVKHLCLDRILNFNDLLDRLGHEVLTAGHEYCWLLPRLDTLMLVDGSILGPGTLESLIWNRSEEADHHGAVQKLMRVLVKRWDAVTSDHLNTIWALGDIQVPNHGVG